MSCLHASAQLPLRRCARASKPCWGAWWPSPIAAGVCMWHPTLTPNCTRSVTKRHTDVTPRWGTAQGKSNVFDSTNTLRPLWWGLPSSLAPEATAPGSLPSQMYVTFPSSQSKIFTLSQGHPAATWLSQAGSGCDSVNQGAQGCRGLAAVSKISSVAGRRALLRGGHRGGGWWTGALAARRGEAGAGLVAAQPSRELGESGSGWQWMEQGQEWGKTDLQSPDRRDWHLHQPPFPLVPTQPQWRLWPHQTHFFTCLHGAVRNSPPVLQECFEHS